MGSLVIMVVLCLVILGYHFIFREYEDDVNVGEEVLKLEHQYKSSLKSSRVLLVYKLEDSEGFPPNTCYSLEDGYQLVLEDYQDSLHIQKNDIVDYYVYNSAEYDYNLKTTYLTGEVVNEVVNIHKG